MSPLRSVPAGIPFGVAAWVVLAVVLAGSAAAQPEVPAPAEVEELIRQGNELRRKGKDYAAVGVFQKAYDLERSPRTAAQLGLAESALGYWLAAERHLGEALAFPRHPWMVKNRPDIEKALANVKTYIAEIEVTGTPDGAEVVVNGRSAGALPLRAPVRVQEGLVQVLLRAPGYQDGKRSLQIGGGKKESVRLALERAKAAPVAPSAVAEAEPTDPAETAMRPPAAGAAGEAPLGMRSRRAHSRAPAWVRPVAWAAAAGAAVALGVGTYGVLRQRSKRDEFDQYTGVAGERCSTSAPNRGGARCPNLYNEAHTAANMAIGGFIVGGLLAGAAITGFVLAPGDDDVGDLGGDDREPALAWRLFLAPNQAQVGYAFRF